MPPFPVSPRMESSPSSPSSSAVAAPPALWRLADRRSRKVGSGNIFSNVNLWQLQRLFRAAGDEDAEQRARVVWGHRDEAELAQALIGLRARGHRRGAKSNGKDVLGSHWLRAFNHLRIGESAASSPVAGPGEDGESGAGGQNSPEPHGASASTPGRTASALGENPEAAVRSSLGLRRAGESDPERYLHRIIH